MVCQRKTITNIKLPRNSTITRQFHFYAYLSITAA
jgi:hypothetical protein